MFGAHHDAITGSESDQVYLDLLTGWREAWDIAVRVREIALEKLAPPPGAGAVAVFNPSVWARSDVARVRIDFAAPGTRSVSVADAPSVVENVERHPDGSIAAADLVFRAVDVPPGGYRTFSLAGSDAGAWIDVDAAVLLHRLLRATALHDRQSGCRDGRWL